MHYSSLNKHFNAISFETRGLENVTNRCQVARRKSNHGLHRFGVVAKTFPLEQIRAALAATKRKSVRQRDLPGHVTVY